MRTRLLLLRPLSVPIRLRVLVISTKVGALASCASLEQIAGELSKGRSLTTQEITSGLKEAALQGSGRDGAVRD